MKKYCVGLLKDTPLLSTIGVVDLMHTANTLGAETYRSLEPYTVAGFIVRMISRPTAAALRQLDALVAHALGVRK